MKTYTAYMRVSTSKQGIDGLGMEAQEQAIKSYNGNVIAKFVEVESGTGKKYRPELIKALEHCKLTNSILIVAKLDRLARNVHFISSLMESKVNFVCCDFPEATPLTLHIMSAVAEHEAKAISTRTKAALAVKKAWYKEHEEALRALGERHSLGSPNLIAGDKAKGSVQGVKTIKEMADSFAQRVKPTIEALKSQNKSLRQIATELNRMNVVTPRGKQWTAMSVKNAYERII